MNNFYHLNSKIYKIIGAVVIFLFAIGIFFGFFHARSQENSSEMNAAKEKADLKIVSSIPLSTVSAGESMKPVEKKESEMTPKILIFHEQEPLASLNPEDNFNKTTHRSEAEPLTALYDGSGYEKFFDISNILELQTQDDAVRLLGAVLEKLHDSTQESNALPEELIDVKNRLGKLSQNIFRHLIDFDEWIDFDLGIQDTFDNPSLSTIFQDERNDSKKMMEEAVISNCEKLLMSDTIDFSKINMQLIQQSGNQAQVELTLYANSQEAAEEPAITALFLWVKNQDNLWKIEDIYFGNISLREILQQEIQSKHQDVSTLV